MGLLYYYDVNCYVRLWTRVLKSGGGDGKNTRPTTSAAKVSHHNYVIGTTLLVTTWIWYDVLKLFQKSLIF